MRCVVSSTLNLLSIINHLVFVSGKCDNFSEIKDDLLFNFSNLHLYIAFHIEQVYYDSHVRSERLYIYIQGHTNVVIVFGFPKWYYILVTRINCFSTILV